MYSLRLLKHAVDSVTSVTGIVATASTHPHHAHLLRRCEISRRWLVEQFNGVLERADAANEELCLDLKNDQAAEAGSGSSGSSGEISAISGMSASEPSQQQSQQVSEQ